MERHRATTSTGAVVDRPTASQLAELVAEVDRSGRDAFLVLERCSRAGGQYLQVLRTRDGWMLDLRDGAPEQHRRAACAHRALVESAVAHWVLRSRAWPELTWAHVYRARATSQPVGLATAV